MMTYLFAAALFAQLLNPVAVDVHDGDTLKVVHGEQCLTLTSIRVGHIDAPELSQPFGKEARDFAAMWAYGRKLTVTPMSTDRYGRTVARVCRGKSPYRCLDYQLVRNGLAWHYTKYSSDRRLRRAQRRAQKEKKGLWSRTNIAPWLWRRSRGAASAPSPSP